MKSDKRTSKLAMWVLLLQEYDFEMIHRAGVTNLDADGFSHNPNPLDEDLTGARWHGNCNQDAVLVWHVVVYLILFFKTSVEVLIQGSDDETNRPQAIADIWKDLLVLHKLQHRTFSLSISAMKMNWIKHQKIRLCWENGLLF